MAAADPQHLSAQYKWILAGAEVAHTEAKLGNKNAALEECRTSIERLERAVDDPTNAYLRGLRARAYGYIGQAYSELAAFPATPSPEAKAHWTAARTMYQLSLDVWRDLSNRGLLANDDAAKPDELASQIAGCDAALGR
jgi:hypothetical protein